MKGQYITTYQAGKMALSYMKRFAVSSITRDRSDLVGNAKGVKIHYFSVNPNEEENQ